MAGKKAHRGLPFDCPGCLRRDTIRVKSYGQKAGSWKLTCDHKGCRTVYYWHEGRDKMMRPGERLP